MVEETQEDEVGDLESDFSPRPLFLQKYAPADDGSDLESSGLYLVQHY